MKRRCDADARPCSVFVNFPIRRAVSDLRARTRPAQPRFHGSARDNEVVRGANRFRGRIDFRCGARKLERNRSLGTKRNGRTNCFLANKSCTNSASIVSQKGESSNFRAVRMRVSDSARLTPAYVLDTIHSTCLAGQS